MKIFFYRLLQCTWGFFQTLAGAVVFLTQLHRPHYLCQGAIVTNWDCRDTGLSLGMFLFIDISHARPKTKSERALCSHEYGHTVQSLLLGPLYLPFIVLPSLIWAGCFKKYRERKKKIYDSFFIEKWATSLGRKYYRGGEE